MSDNKPIRYATAGGATVTITPTTSSAPWACDGCHHSRTVDYSSLQASIDKAKDEAQRHADQCRALPPR